MKMVGKKGEQVHILPIALKIAENFIHCSGVGVDAAELLWKNIHLRSVSVKNLGFRESMR